MVKINRKLKKEYPTIDKLQKKMNEDLKADGNGNVPVD
jgi:hypothetical protein